MHSAAMRKGNGCEPASESNTEYETINSLVEALSSVSGSLSSSLQSSGSSSASVASLSLNFTAPVPDARPSQRTTASARKSSTTATRRDTRSSPCTPEPTVAGAQNSQVWQVATGQPHNSRLRRTPAASHHGRMPAAPARFSACTSTSQPLPLPHWQGHKQQLHMAVPGNRGGVAVAASASAYSPPLPCGPQAVPGLRHLTAIRTAHAHTSGLSMAQLNELAEIMDEIIRRMAPPRLGAANELNTGAGSSAPLTHAVPSQAEPQDLSSLLLEAEQVMVALRQLPNAGGNSASGALGAPVRSMLHKVQSWVEHSQLSSLNTSSTSQAPLSPLSHRSQTASPRHTLSMSPTPLSPLSHRSLTVPSGHALSTSDSDMLDFIPALALPMQSEGLPSSISRVAEALALCAPPQPAASASTIREAPTDATRFLPSSHRSATEVPASTLASRRSYATKPGSSTDTLPGPPATPFSAASDSDAVGPSTPSNSFAPGSGGTRPPSLPATKNRAILPVKEGAGSDAPVSTTLDSHDILSAITTAWSELPRSQARTGPRGKAESKGQLNTSCAQPTRAWWSRPFHLCFGSSTGCWARAQHCGGMPQQTRRKLTAAKRYKEDHITVGCSCL